MAINDDSYYWQLPQNQTSNQPSTQTSKSYFDAPGYTQLNATEGLDFGNVKQVQQWLNKNINAGLADDNMYGAKTNEAINNLLNKSGIVLTDEERQNFINLQNSMKGKWVGAKVKNTTRPIQATQAIQESNVQNQQQVPYDYSWVIGNDIQHNKQEIPTFKGKDAYYTKGEAEIDYNTQLARSLGYPSVNIPKLKELPYYQAGLSRFLNQYIDNGNFWNNGKFNFGDRYTRKHQQGGTMGNQEELQKAFMAFLIEDAAAQGMQIQSEQDLQAYAQQLGEEGLKAKYQEFMQKMQGGVKAALGAKLNYIRKIKGLCPEGEELVYMKQGGRVCPVCQKKRQEKVEMNQKGGNAITKFKDSRKEDKYDVNEHNNLIRKYRNKTISKEELDRLHDLNKHPNTTHEESYWATERPKPKSITNKKKLVDKNACGSKMKKK